MPERVFSAPYTETRYFPTHFRTHDDVIEWDASQNDNVIAELQHLIASIQNDVYNLRVSGVLPHCSKIDVIKQIRTDTGLGLKESKDIADGNAFFRGVSRTRAYELVRSWHRYGATVAVFNARGESADEIPF